MLTGPWCPYNLRLITECQQYIESDADAALYRAIICVHIRPTNQPLGLLSLKNTTMASPGGTRREDMDALAPEPIKKDKFSASVLIAEGKVSS